MASRASVRAYCVLGCTIWFAKEIYQKHGQDNKVLVNDALNLKFAANRAYDLWKDPLTKNQTRRIHREIKKVFDGPEDALRVAGMLLVILEEIHEHVKSEKQEALGEVYKYLSKIVREHYDTEGNEWDLYEQSIDASRRFNKMVEGV